MKKTIMIVGASGFVGTSVCNLMYEKGMDVVDVSRNANYIKDIKHIMMGDLLDLHSEDFWSSLLSKSGSVDTVVYLAARVHVMNDMHIDPLEAYRKINKDSAISLAQEAAARGVRRFIYLSSVKVNGEASTEPFREIDTPAPTDPYGVSKMEAEQELLAFGRDSGLEVVVIRSPLVYGPGVRANFMSLLKIVGRGIPLPIGAIKNKRSMIYVENLADFILTCTTHPDAAGEVFFASDGLDLSTPELTRQLAEAQGVVPRFPAVPVAVLRMVAAITKRQAIVQRLTESLQVSGEKARTVLGWTAPYPVWQALAHTARSVKSSALHKPSQVPDRIRLLPRQQAYLRLRSLLERSLAVVLLVFLSPLLLLLGFLIRSDSKGPALFIQSRAGRKHKPFLIYKFRTMRVGTPNLSTEEMQQSATDPVTGIGRFLRRTSLDELPQLLNIVRGEMSFVGPRPALLTQTRVLELRTGLGVEQLTPGITGYAQATGRDDLDDKEKVKRDAEYMKRVSLTEDLRIVYLTLESVLKGTGNK